MSELHLLEPLPFADEEQVPGRQELTLCGMLYTLGLRTEDVKDAWLHQLATREVCTLCFECAGNKPTSPSHLSYRLRTNYGKSLCFHEHTSPKAARECSAIPQGKQKHAVLTIGFYNLKPIKWLPMKGEV